TEQEDTGNDVAQHQRCSFRPSVSRTTLSVPTNPSNAVHTRIGTVSTDSVLAMFKANPATMSTTRTSSAMVRSRIHGPFTRRTRVSSPARASMASVTMKTTVTASPRNSARSGRLVRSYGSCAVLRRAPRPVELPHAFLRGADLLGCSECLDGPHLHVQGMAHVLVHRRGTHPEHVHVEAVLRPVDLEHEHTGTQRDHVGGRRHEEVPVHQDRSLDDDGLGPGTETSGVPADTHARAEQVPGQVQHESQYTVGSGE